MRKIDFEEQLQEFKDIVNHYCSHRRSMSKEDELAYFHAITQYASTAYTDEEIYETRRIWRSLVCLNICMIGKYK